MIPNWVYQDSSCCGITLPPMKLVFFNVRFWNLLIDKLYEIIFFQDENYRLPKDEVCGSIKIIFNLHSNHLACKIELVTLVGARSKMKFGILLNWIQRLICLIKATWEEIKLSQNYGPKLGQKWNFSKLDFSFINRCAFPWAKFPSHFFSWINEQWPKFLSLFFSRIGEERPQNVKPKLSTMASRTALIPC